VIGFGIGGGGIATSNCGDGFCGGALSGEFHIGFMVTPRFALMGDFWGNIHPIDDAHGGGSTTTSIDTIAAQIWLNDFFWLKGGIGGAQFDISDNALGVDHETGFGILAGAGLEVVQSPFFAMDLQLRYGRGSFSTGPDVNNWALMAGFTWY
jgi:hypothetical protein